MYSPNTKLGQQAQIMQLHNNSYFQKNVLKKKEGKKLTFYAGMKLILWVCAWTLDVWKCKNKIQVLPGLEPGIFRLGGERVNHYATEPILHILSVYSVIVHDRSVDSRFSATIKLLPQIAQSVRNIKKTLESG